MSDKEANLKAIGSRISHIREKKGITQEKLSEMLKIKREKLAKWETGLQDLKTQDIVALSKALNVTSDYLLGLSEQPTNDKDLAAVADYLNITLSAARTLDTKSVFSLSNSIDINKYYDIKPCEFASYYFNKVRLFLEEVENDITDFFSKMPKRRFENMEIETAYNFRQNLMIRYFMFDKSLPNLGVYIDKLIFLKNTTNYSSSFFEINKIFKDFGDIDLESYKDIFDIDNVGAGYFYADLFDSKNSDGFPL